MSNRILLKKSDVSNAVPKLADVQLGELAINTNDGDIFFKRENTILTPSEEIGKFAVYKTIHTGETLTIESLTLNKFRLNGDRTADFPIGTPMVLSDGTAHHNAKVTDILYFSNKSSTDVTFSPASTFSDATMVMFNPVYLRGLAIDEKMYFNEGGIYKEVTLPMGLLQRFTDDVDPMNEGWKFIDNPSGRTGSGSVNLMRVGDAIQNDITYIDGVKYAGHTTAEIAALPDSELGTFVFDTTKNTLVQCLDATVGANVWGIRIDGGTY